MKKYISWVLVLVLVLMMIPVTTTDALAVSNDLIEIDLVITDDTTILVFVPSEYQSLISEQEMIDIAIRDGLQDGEIITFYEVGETEIPESISPFSLPTFVTTRSNFSSEWAAQNYFVISVAKGQTTTLISKFTQTLIAGITAGTPYSITAELKATITAEHSITQQFVGPPENGIHNTREFRVQFYAHNFNWTQEHYNMYGIHVGTRSGTGHEPTRWASYSIDRTI